MTHARSLYRQVRIIEHRMQCIAAMRVMLYLSERYTAERTHRHREAIIRALQREEG